MVLTYQEAQERLPAVLIEPLGDEAHDEALIAELKDLLKYYAGYVATLRIQVEHLKAVNQALNGTGQDITEGLDGQVLKELQNS
jgi:hypothetical protein